MRSLIRIFGGRTCSLVGNANYFLVYREDHWGVDQSTGSDKLGLRRIVQAFVCVRLAVVLLVIFFCSEFQFVVERSSAFDHNAEKLCLLCV